MSTYRDQTRGTESDFEHLVRMAEKVRGTYVDIGEAEWAASPVDWIRQVSSSHKRGKIGESLVMEWARTSGLKVRPRLHRGHDCVIADAKVEVKLSLRWNSGEFTFLGICAFDYDVAALLGIAPTSTYLWVVPKAILWEHAKEQARGASGRGSKWLKFPSEEPPEWLRHWGGSFDDAREALERAQEYARQEQDESSTKDSVQDLSPTVDWSWFDELLKVGP